MANKQDSYWMEYTLDEKVDQKVCEYLREHHAKARGRFSVRKGHSVRKGQGTIRDC